MLSAAHCGGEFTRVEIGRRNLSDASEDYESVNIAFEVIHPDFELGKDNGDEFVLNDMMLVKLQSSFSYETVLLDDESVDLVPGIGITAIGWEYTNKSIPKLSDVLLEADMEYIENKKCAKIHNNSITNDMICAMHPEKTTSFCICDSGGPIIIKSENVSLDVQLGISSMVAECNPNFHSVEVCIKSGLAFIKNIQACAVPHGTEFDRCTQATCMID